MRFDGVEHTWVRNLYPGSAKRASRIGIFGKFRIQRRGGAVMGDSLHTIGIEMWRACPHPGGRYRTDGPCSGEAFREDYLVPELSEDQTCVTVSLIGVPGLSSSFLEEAFGGLVRVNGFTRDFLKEHLSFERSEDWHREATDEIWDHISSATAGVDP